MLSNLHDLFEEKTNNFVDNIGTNQENNFEFVRANKESNKEKVDEVLGEVTNALDKIKTDLLRFNSDGILTVEVPIIKNERRYRRDLADETTANTTVTENSTLLRTAETTTVKIDVVTEELVTEKPEEKLEVLRVNNETEDISGRRMMPERRTSRVKDKLLSYLEDIFNDVERKIRPLTNIKIALSNDDHYRIGYIIATLDTLEVNLKKMRSDMRLHHHYWDDEKVLDLFDRIKATNAVATSLIESLKKYLPKY